MTYYFSTFFFVIFLVSYIYYYFNAEKNTFLKLLSLMPKNVSHLSATRKSNVSHIIIRNKMKL
jgi:hypothetical protein